MILLCINFLQGEDPLALSFGSMKKTTTILLLILWPMIFSFSQELLYQIHQQPATEQQVKSFLHENSCHAEYSFAVILPVGGCPRCEGAIPLFFNHAKKKHSDSNRILIAVSDKTKAAQIALSKKQYGADTTVFMTTNSPFLQHFTFETGYIGVPYLMVFDNEAGLLINATSTLGLQYSEFFYNKFTQDLRPAQTCHEIIGSDTVISKVSNYTVSEDFTKLALIDHITSDIIFCELQGDHYAISEIIRPSSLEYSLFKSPDVPDEFTTLLQQMNVLNVFYLDLAFDLKRNRIIATASLPELYWENIETEDLAYKNKACILIYDLEAKEKTIIPLQITSETMADHTEMYFDYENETLFIPIKKGWPVIGTTDEPSIPEEDPETEGFYLHCPMLAEFTLDNGLFVQHIGTIPYKHKLLKSGYFYFNPKVQFDQEEMVLADCYTGELFFLDRKTKALHRQANLLNQLPDSLYQEKEKHHLSLPNTSNRLQALFDKITNFPFRLVDFCIHDNALHGIITDETNSYYCIWHLSNPQKPMEIHSLELRKEIVKNTKIISLGNDIVRFSIDDTEETVKITKSPIIMDK